MMKQYSKYSRKNVLVIWFLLGLVGGHRFYTRKYITGILYLFTIGFFGLGYLYDGYLILTNEFFDKSGLQIKPGKKLEKTIFRHLFNHKNYAKMQREFYDIEAQYWSLENKNPVVGSYDDHNNWSDYDKYLFKNIDTKNMVALDFGTGPGRNIVKFRNNFKKIDGVDISKINLEKAKQHLESEQIFSSKLYLTNGYDLKGISSNKYDMVFSTITFQHICSHKIRFSLFKEIFRILKVGGHFSCQMGFGGITLKEGQVVTSGVNYFDNYYTAEGTNGFMDVNVLDENNLKLDLIKKIGFKDYISDIRPVGPSDKHKNWIYFQVKK